MKPFVLSPPTRRPPSAEGSDIFTRVRAAARLTGVLAVLSLTLLTSAAQATAGLEPGVHIDPGSPAAKEYVIPLHQARGTGAAGSSSSNSATPLFGSGVGPRGPGGAAHSGSAGKTAGGGQRTGSAPVSRATPESLSGSTLPASASRTSSGGGGSTLALLGGAAAVLLLGGLGGTVLRRSRHSTGPGIAGPR
jgi:hypothetical protein